MILNNKEKKNLIDTLSWMITDMKYRYDETKRNVEKGSQGDYSPELKAAMNLLEDVEKVKTTEVIGLFKSVPLNCREFECVHNKKGRCQASNITLQSRQIGTVGMLLCVEAEVEEN